MRFRGIQEYLTTVRELTPMLVKPRASKNELPQTLEPESLQSKNMQHTWQRGQRERRGQTPIMNTHLR